MINNEFRFVPITPDGTALVECSAHDEYLAWSKLRRLATVVSYKTKQEFIRAGYRMEKWDAIA